MNLLRMTDRLMLIIGIILLRLSTNPTGTTKPDDLIRITETGERRMGVQLMGQTMQQATTTFDTDIIDTVGAAQDRLHTEIMRVTPGEERGHSLDLHQEPNPQIGVLAHMRMSIDQCRVLLKTLGPDVACKFPMFREYFYAQQASSLVGFPLFECTDGGTSGY